MSKKDDEKREEQSPETAQGSESAQSLGGDYIQQTADPAQPGAVSDPGNSGAVTPAAKADENKK